MASSARLGESENTLSVRSPQPHTTNQCNEEKEKTVGDKRNVQIKPRRRLGSALKLSHAVPHYQTRGHQDRSTKALKAAQRSCCTKKFYTEEAHTIVNMSNHSTSSNTCRTCGKGSAPLRGCKKMYIFILLYELHYVSMN